MGAPRASYVISSPSMSCHAPVVMDAGGFGPTLLWAGGPIRAGFVVALSRRPFNVTTKFGSHGTSKLTTQTYTQD